MNGSITTPGRARLPLVAAAVAALAALQTAFCADPEWPNWRGPTWDGISTESDWNPAALKDGASVAWKTNVGRGYSSVAIKGGRLYTLGHRGNDDAVLCLDAKSGAELWRHTYPCEAGSYEGPRSTPTIDGGSVYTISREGLLLCLDAARGTVTWKVNIVEQAGAKPPTWAFAGSPRIEGDLLLLNGGETGLALDKKSGVKVWGSTGTGGYATPVPYSRAGTPSLVIFGQKAAYGVDLRTGKPQWSFPWVTSYDVNAADPIPLGTKIFISSGYNKGCALIDASGPEPKALWQNTKICAQFSSCVLLDGCLYGIDGNYGSGSLKCLKFETGEELWSQNLGFGSLMAADGKLIVLNEKGALFIAEATPAGYKELSSAKGVLSSTCWTMPVLCGGRIYCRNEKGALVCVDVSRPRGR